MKRYGKWNTRSEHGFTLIELLVVILIIGILTAIAVPMFLNQRKAAVDASLKTDLRNVAAAYNTWRLTPGNDNARFRALTGNGLSSWISGPDSYVSSNDPGRIHWSSNPELPQASVSNGGNIIEFLVMGVPSASWTRPHGEGEFCAVGNNPNSNYDYIGDSGMGRINFHRSLYYDSKMGRVVTMAEMIDAMDSGEEISCYWYAQA